MSRGGTQRCELGRSNCVKDTKVTRPREQEMRPGSITLWTINAANTNVLLMLMLSCNDYRGATVVTSPTLVWQFTGTGSLKLPHFEAVLNTHNCLTAAHLSVCVLHGRETEQESPSNRDNTCWSGHQKLQIQPAGGAGSPDRVPFCYTIQWNLLGEKQAIIAPPNVCSLKSIDSQ